MNINLLFGIFEKIKQKYSMEAKNKQEIWRKRRMQKAKHGLRLPAKGLLSLEGGKGFRAMAEKAGFIMAE